MKKRLGTCLLMLLIGIGAHAGYDFDKIEPKSPQILIDTTTAVSTGVENYQTHQRAFQMSEHEQKIDAWFNNRQILNSLSRNLSEANWSPKQPYAIREGIKAIRHNVFVERLTTLFLQNQSKIPLEKVDHEYAVELVRKALIETIIRNNKNENN